MRKIIDLKSKTYNLKSLPINRQVNYIIGLDEVGRGALAGPVVVAAVAIQVNFKFKILNSKLKLKDSKKLSAKQRELWFEWIKQNNIPFAIAKVSHKVIDQINISNAANLAATRAFIKLTKNYKLKIKSCNIFLDGGLYIKPKTKNQKSYVCRQTGKLNTKTIIRGDEKIPAISLASIVAKVARDKLMKKAHKKYPYYDFINNVGYGAKNHIKAIKKIGHSKIHRKSFKFKK